ncbi:hypothetical protein ACFSUM_18660 [Virgibacillus siamensis]|uniref:hypothetical protein n=1 Tax=Bacillales TaxID=1385 RepID=UPI00096D38C5|nr:hypothetical protein [Paenibacillus sp. FSL H7-0326]OMC71376.1 hypothetical protein BK126_04565 [Paenibacillus sp. FSL H7-0326]
MSTIEKKMYRMKAQTETITITMFPKVATTHEESENEAKKHLPFETKPFVVEEICSEEEWKEGQPNFCPRCGSRTSFDDNGFYECSDCEAQGHVSVEI